MESLKEGLIEEKKESEILATPESRKESESELLDGLDGKFV